MLALSNDTVLTLSTYESIKARCLKGGVRVPREEIDGDAVVGEVRHQPPAQARHRRNTSEPDRPPQPTLRGLYYCAAGDMVTATCIARDIGIKQPTNQATNQNTNHHQQKHTNTQTKQTKKNNEAKQKNEPTNQLYGVGSNLRGSGSHSTSAHPSVPTLSDGSYLRRTRHTCYHVAAP